ncbi:hypothetical protein HC031_30165 [Planosporangium thailandense]|uniref:DUF11 domain-containing protein n=1 Tax=Planosporangium thailandense TaxID=765197 RepID=A0ABX0Y982_9ACTN|nr:DUF11 domain-containing protein [Planosporangium thailandense]NJC73947.1 hypothetical protein [Planosporangium thailandense]
MWLVRAAHVAAVAAAVAGSALVAPALARSTPAAAAGTGVDVTPTLSSTPFGAPPGQRVTHTITLSATGTGSLPAVRVTFTTTVALDGVAANASAGSCPIVTPLTVVCDLGNLDFAGTNSTGPAGPSSPQVTITGTVHSGTAGGALVQNLVNITAGAADADPTNNVTSNAYLVPGGSTAPLAPSSGRPLAEPAASRAPAHGMSPVVVVALSVLAVLVVAALVIVLRRRRRPSPADGDDGGARGV